MTTIGMHCVSIFLATLPASKESAKGVPQFSLQHDVKTKRFRVTFGEFRFSAGDVDLQLKTAAKTGRFVGTLALTGRATCRSQEFHATADNIQLDVAMRTLSLKGNVKVWNQSKKGEPTTFASADRMELNLRESVLFFERLRSLDR